VDPETIVAPIRGALRELAQDGLLTRRQNSLKVHELGRLFLRNIAMLFDAYRQSDGGAQPQQPVFSRTV